MVFSICGGGNRITLNAADNLVNCSLRALNSSAVVAQSYRFSVFAIVHCCRDFSVSVMPRLWSVRRDKSEIEKILFHNIIITSMDICMILLL